MPVRHDKGREVTCFATGKSSVNTIHSLLLLQCGCRITPDTCHTLLSASLSTSQGTVQIILAIILEFQGVV